MSAWKWIVLALALVQGGWLTFDGSRAFIKGDYVTPSSGPRAGQLGPWARLVTAAGLEPRSAVVKSAHVLLGLGWFAGAALFALHPAPGWRMLLGCAVATLWYLPVGTLGSLLVIALLLSPSLRGG